jgi:hypothetical protein
MARLWSSLRPTEFRYRSESYYIGQGPTQLFKKILATNTKYPQQPKMGRISKVSMLSGLVLFATQNISRINIDNVTNLTLTRQNALVELQHRERNAGGSGIRGHQNITMEGVMKRTFVVWIMLLLVAPVAFITCGSIIKGGSDTLNVRSTPDQADVAIFDETGKCVCNAKTPTIVTLEKKKGYFSGKTYTVKITKAGYSDQSATVDTTANGWYIGGNILVGGLIGWLVVDPLTGGMWSLDTKDLNVTLGAAKKDGEPPKATQPAGKDGEPPKEATQPPKESGQLETLQFHVMLLQDVPVSLRTSMVKISE